MFLFNWEPLTHGMKSIYVAAANQDEALMAMDDAIENDELSGEEVECFRNGKYKLRVFKSNTVVLHVND